MRHGKTNRKFGRTNKQRAAFVNALAVSLISRNKMTTSEARAKELRPFVEQLVTMSRKKTPSMIRRLNAFLPASVVKRLVEEIGPRYHDRAGGYTRIRHLPPRRSDGARLAVIEFV